MADVNINLRITVEWRQEDGDGGTCMVCGDGCWLTLHRAYFCVDGGDWEGEREHCVRFVQGVVVERRVNCREEEASGWDTMP